MIKIASPDNWSNLLQAAPAVSRIKLTDDGKLGPHDRQQFTKRASGSEAIFLPYLSQVKFAKDEVPVHLIALGAHEYWGANRNGDGFRKAALERYGDTFVKFAKFYRNHDNKDPKNSFGVVKLAVYNPEMHRTELLVGLNATKSAAERNEGHIADEEMNALDQKGEFPVSMACHVPYDECSYCGHKAKTRNDYCTEEKCAAGGCDANLTKLVKVGNLTHHMFVHNDHPRFFDISKVWRPADRTAYGSRADWIKQANDFAQTVKAGSTYVPAPVLLDQYRNAGGWSEQYTPRVEIAAALSQLETSGACRGIDTFSGVSREPVTMPKLAEADVDGYLAALADECVVLPIAEFTQLTKQGDLNAGSSGITSNIYTRLIGSGELEIELRKNRYDLENRAVSRRNAELARLTKSAYSLRCQDIQYRSFLASFRGIARPVEKRAAAITRILTPVERSYAAYTLAAISRMTAKFAADEVYSVVRSIVAQNERN